MQKKRRPLGKILGQNQRSQRKPDPERRQNADDDSDVAAIG